MGINFADHLTDSGYHDITPEQEREIEARQECAHRGIDPDEICADGGVTAWMVVDRERSDPMAFSWWGSDAPTHAMVDITRASESIAAMVADWYGNAPLPNARISADVIAQRLARFAAPQAVPAEDIGPIEDALHSCVCLLETLAESAKERDDHTEGSMMSVMAENCRAALTASETSLREQIRKQSDDITLLDELSRLREALKGIRDAANSFQDEEGYEVAAQIRIRVDRALSEREGQE